MSSENGRLIEATQRLKKTKKNFENANFRALKSMNRSEQLRTEEGHVNDVLYRQRVNMGRDYVDQQEAGWMVQGDKEGFMVPQSFQNGRIQNFHSS